MAYNAQVLSAKIYEYFRTHPLDPNGVTAVDVQSSVDADGRPTVNIIQTTGPVYLDEKLARLIADAVAYAVVSHLDEES